MSTIEEQLPGLRTHLRAYQLGDLAPVAEAALRTLAAAGPARGTQVSSNTFLNADGPVTCTVLTSGPDFLLWLAAATPPMLLAEHFPQLLPYSPWGLLDTESFPFPHLAGVGLSNANWDYIYLSAGDAAARARLTQPLEAELFGKLSPEIRAFAQANGGLYYRGAVALDSAVLLATGSALAPLVPALLAVDVAGCITYRDSVRPLLALQVPLFSKTGRELGSAKIDHISLALELTSSLADPDALPLAGRRRVGVVGQLVVGSTTLTMTGSWPLDDDDLQLSLVCSTSQLTTWFADTPLASLPWPKSAVEAAVTLVVSRQSGRLEKARFTFETTGWVIAAGDFGFTLQEVKLAVTVFSPTTLQLTIASFAAKAKLGATQLLCTGNYPDGEYALGLDPATPIYLSDLVKALGKSSNLPSFPQKLAITGLSGSYHSGTGYKAFNLTIASATGWDTGDTSLGFNLSNLSLGIYGTSAYVFKLRADFTYTFRNVPGLVVAFTGAAEYDASWTFSLRSTASDAIKLSTLGTEFGFVAPAQLDAFAFKALGFGADVVAGQKYFRGEGAISLFGEKMNVELLVSKTADTTAFSGSFASTIDGRPALFTIGAASGKSSRLELKMLFTIAGVDIYLAATSETTAAAGAEKKLSEKQFTGGTRGLSLPVFDLLNGLMSYAGLHIPDELNPDLNLKDIYVSYNGATKQLDLVALGAVAGQEVQLFFQYQPASTGREKQYVFGIDTSISLDTLSKLPLVGSQLKEITLSGIGFVYASREGKFTLPALSGTAADEAVRTIDLAALAEKSYKGGVSFTGEVGLPFRTQPLTLALPIGGQEAPPSPGAAPAATALAGAKKPAIAKPTMLTTTADDATKWFALDSKIGPVQLKRFGLAYADKKLYLLISAELGMAGIGVNLEGLGIGFDPVALLAGHFEPEFKLAGLGIFFTKPGLTIEGAIVRLSAQQLSVANARLDQLNAGLSEEEKRAQHVKFQFDGALIVQTAAWGLSAVASYAQLEKGTVSLFIFLDVNYALGGPPFFFVEGLMGGFGINRTLRIPTFEQVREFPLLRMDAPAGSAQSRAMATLAKLQDGDNPWITTREGDYWLAVGVKFSTFKFVHGELLLIATFGRELEFTLLGLAWLTLPLPPEGQAVGIPFVFLELQMAAVVQPAKGFFSVAGSLTPDSYVLTKYCHITGGFAYSMWYGSNPHAGDFVMTAGGYHPAFKVPDHYPQVARMGYNWQVSDNVSIKGQSYFAITPACGMAGTSLEVVFEAGDIKVWFIARADMLVTWHPLSFIAEISVEIGASIRLNLLFCHKTVTVSLGASLTLWGPPLGGIVRVHVVVVDIAIRFGDEGALNRNYEALRWAEFRNLLPAPADVCKIIANSGLTETLKEEGKKDVWVVRAGTFGFTAQSAIPVSSLAYGPSGQQVVAGSPLRIRPMNATQATSVFNLRISREPDSEDIYGQVNQWEVTADKGNLDLVKGSMPPALWGAPLVENGRFVQAPAAPSNEVLKDQVVGCYVKAPAANVGNTFGNIGLDELQYEQVAWGLNPLCPTPVPALKNYQTIATKERINPETKAKETAAQQLEKPMLKATSTKRDSLFGVLAAAGVLCTTDDSTKLDLTQPATLSELATHYESLFAEAPLLLA
jgi:hypothetical protein